MSSFKISYSRKDVFVKNLLEADCEIPASNLVALAVEYFFYTSKYIPLGTVEVKDTHPDKTSKNIYVNDKAGVGIYLQEMKEKGVSYKKAIFSILNLCIEPGEETAIISRTEFLRYENELLKIKSNVVPTAQKEPFKASNKPKETSFQGDASFPLTKENKAPEKAITKAQQQEESNYSKKQKKKLSFADDFIKTF